jgi:glycosyltransferase involved in cell wall biosynthesis
VQALGQLYRLNPKVSIHIVSGQLGIKANFPFTLHYRLTDKQLANLYSQVNVLLFTSEFEGYGLPPLEAFACGTNVVSTNFLGNEYLVDGENCFLAKTPEAFAKAALQLMSSCELAKQQLEKAKATVERHNFETVTQKMLALFQ